MKTIAITFLALSLPAALFAQQAKLLDIKIPDEPAKQAAEIVPVIQPGASKAKKAAPPAAPRVKQAPAAPAVKQAAAAPAARPSRPARPGERTVQPKQDPASAFMPSELLKAAGLSQSAMQSGGFVVGKKHTVSRGDTLWDLSGKYYKNPFMWGRIYNANFKSVANPDLINPREELIIPDLNEIVIPYRRVPVAAAALEPAEMEAGAYTPSGRTAAARRAALPEPGEILRDFDESFLSEEMPEHQVEWGNGVKIVPEGWRADGVVTAKLKNDDDFLDEGLSMTGETLQVTMEDAGRVRPGDYLAVYLKGSDAHDKSGKFIGREVQPAGLAEVFSVEGTVVKARVIDATTPISPGYIVKKK